MREFSSADVYDLLGIPQRTLDYWDERNVVKPSIQQADGKGTVRKYSFRDLVDLTVVIRLRDTGLSLQRIRKGLECVRQTKKPSEGDVFLVTDGKDLFEKRKGNKLVSVLRGGQMGFSVVFLGEIPTTLNKSIRNLDAGRAQRDLQKKTKMA